MKKRYIGCCRVGGGGGAIMHCIGNIEKKDILGFAILYQGYTDALYR